MTTKSGGMWLFRSPWPHREYPNRLEVEGHLSQEVVDALHDVPDHISLKALVSYPFPLDFAPPSGGR